MPVKVYNLKWIMSYSRLKKMTYVSLILLDFAGILLAFLLSYLLRSHIPTETYYLPEYEYSILSIIMGFFYIIILHSGGVHKDHPFKPWQIEAWAVGSGLFKGTILFMALAFLYREFSISRLIIVLHLVLAIMILSLLRLLWRVLVIKPAISKGAGKRILSLLRSDTNGSTLKEKKKSDQTIITRVWNENRKMSDLEKVIIDYGIDGIELDERSFSVDSMLDIALTASRMGIDLRVKPDLVGLLPLNFSLQEIDGEFYWTAGRGLRELYPRTLKRIMDIVLSIILIILFFIPGLIISLIIAITSPGGVFFSHERIGKKGRRFKVLKFRTMYKDAEERLRKDPELYKEFLKGFKLKNDPRITPIGKFLRKTSLDEVPQLMNIFKGEMSFVGPRPVITEELEKYGKLQALLISVPPGLTGLWQVSGRSELTYDERVRLDLYYVENWTLALDANILIRTFPAVLSSRGSY